jgi:hypothetical protein
VLIFNHQFDGLQAITDARAGNALTVIDFKQRVVGGTLYEHIVHVEKLIFLPVQVGARVWATIDISSEYTILVHDKQGNCVEPPFDSKGF